MEYQSPSKAFKASLPNLSPVMHRKFNLERLPAIWLNFVRVGSRKAYTYWAKENIARRVRFLSLRDRNLHPKGNYLRNGESGADIPGQRAYR